MLKTVIGVFGTRTRAREVLNHLEAAGFDVQNVTVLTAPQNANPHAKDTQAGKNINRDEELQDNVNSTLIPTTYASLTSWMLPPGLTGSTGGLAEVPAPISSDPAKTAGSSQGIDVEGTLPSAGVAKTLKSFGLNSDQIDDFQRQLQQGAVLVAVEIVDPKMVAKAEEILRDEQANTGVQ